MKKNATKTSFERLNDQNFKIVKDNETMNLYGGVYYYYPATWYRKEAKTGFLMLGADYEQILNQD